MYKKVKTVNEQLELLNACVSHELRNPLNSIRARNLEKKHLYKLLRKKIAEEIFDDKEYLDIITKLEKGCSVQT
jgi:signal transduction histidine kinase